jgi:hypothetical protein
MRRLTTEEAQMIRRWGRRSRLGLLGVSPLVVLFEPFAVWNGVWALRGGDYWTGLLMPALAGAILLLWILWWRSAGRAGRVSEATRVETIRGVYRVRCHRRRRSPRIGDFTVVFPTRELRRGLVEGEVYEADVLFAGLALVVAVREASGPAQP